MTGNYVSSIGRNFLERIDEFLLNNNQTLKCADVADIYFEFFKDLKDFKGNAHGFTGLSELLIFRFLYHLLDGSFKPNWVTKHMAEFVSKSRGLRIGQSIRIAINGERYNPDIVVYQDGVLKAIFQIKVYLTRGRSEIVKEMKTLKKIKHARTKMKALLIIFGELSRKGKLFYELEKQRDENRNWFDFVILRGNNELLGKKLLRYLGFSA